MLKYFLILISLVLGAVSYGQLADGSTAPDFTLTDYVGNEHHLNSYLNDGKTVILEIFAAHCPTCWNYHLTNRLKNLYNSYGPDGTDELIVLALEHDPGNNNNAFIGNGPPWVTQGNWLDGTPFPIFNVEGADRSVFDDYNLTGYPVVYKICPDGITERIFTSETEAQVYEKVQACQGPLSVDDRLDLGAVYFDPSSQNLNISQYQKVMAVRIMSITGQVVQTITDIDSPSTQIAPLNTGIYLFEIQSSQGSVVKRFFVN